MDYFRHYHAARNWAAYQKRWYGRASTVTKLDNPTAEGAYWVVKVEGDK